MSAQDVHSKQPNDFDPVTCTGNCRAYSARRHRYGDHAGDGAQPTR
jgi:hypothetical protein